MRSPDDSSNAGDSLNATPGPDLGHDPVLPQPPPIPVRGPTWRDMIRALVLIWAFALSVQLAAVAGIGIYAQIADRDAQEVFMQPAIIVPLSIMSLLFAVAAGWYVSCRKYGRTLAQGLALRSVSAGSIAQGAAIGFVGALFAMILMGFVGQTQSTMSELISGESGEGLSMLMLVFALVVPPLEELYYRGFLYTAFRRLMGIRFAFPLIVCWFGLVHAFQLANDWVSLAVVAAMGGIWTLLRERHDSVVPSIVSHFTYNLVLVVAMATAYTLS